MDPRNPESYNHRTELLSTGKKYHFVDQLPANYNPSSNTTPTVTLLCIHGFPDLWYTWRFLIIPWVKTCGFRVVVPDMLGYGGTDKPAVLSQYSFKSLCADMNALLDVIGVKSAFIIGHDWGAVVASRFALRYPRRTMGLVTLSVPFYPPKVHYVSLEEIAKRLPGLAYQMYFNDPVSTKEIESNISNFLIAVHKSGVDSVSTTSDFLKARSASESYLTSDELDYYINNFRKGGMNGPLNYYRTRKINFTEEFESKLSSYMPASIPVLLMYGNKDQTCARSAVEQSLEYAPQTRVFELFGVGHWVTVMAHETVSTAVAEFVRTTVRHGAVARSKL